MMHAKPIRLHSLSRSGQSDFTSQRKGQPACCPGAENNVGLGFASSRSGLGEWEMHDDDDAALGGTRDGDIGIGCSILYQSWEIILKSEKKPILVNLNLINPIPSP